MKKSNLNIYRYLFFFLFCFLVVIMLFPVQSTAQQTGIELMTQFPSIAGTAGEDITFSIKIKNYGSRSELINLEVSSKPQEWVTTLRGRGRNIQQVMVEGGGSENVDLIVKIPDNVEIGDYPLTIAAVSERGSKSTLALNISISHERLGDDRLSARYIELKGPNDATFDFRLDLKNNSSTEQLYSLGVQLGPGWQATFTPANERQQVASISVKPGESRGIDVKITPPVTVKEGEYTILVEAISPTSRVTEELKIIISGTYDLEFTTSTGRLNADVIAGRETKVNLEAKNNGSAPLNNINFSSKQPNNWAVTFEPDTIEVLQPGESRQITATISADAKAIAGDYVVSLTASTKEVRSSADLRVTVKTSTLWGLVGVIIVVGVIAGLYHVFRKYGRR
ncbi:MAG: NEW3 domain-containing protein [Bacillota bacterium]